VAAGALYKLDALSGTSKFPISYDWKVEEARLFWAKGEVETAKYLLKNLTDSMERVSFVFILCTVVARLSFIVTLSLFCPVHLFVNHNCDFVSCGVLSLN